MSIVAACNHRARRRRRRRDPLVPVSLPASHATVDHVLLCQLGPNICGRCKYSKFRRKWGDSLKDRHQRDGQDLNPIEERVDPTSGAWTLGCQPCNVSAKSCAWGTYSLCKYAVVQQCAMHQHCDRKTHIASCKAQGTEVAPKLGSKASTAEAARNSVGADKFLWAITTTHSASSYRDYARFMKTNAVAKVLLARDQAPGETPAGTLGSSMVETKTCQRCVRSLSAVVVEDDQEFLDRAVRFAYAVDDSDQVNTVYGRLVAANPTISVRDIVAGIDRDYGFSVEDQMHSILRCIDQLARVRKGKRAGDTDYGTEDYTCGARALRLRKIAFCGASDGCKVVLNAIRKLKEDNHLPGQRWHWRDGTHTLRTVEKTILKYVKPEEDDLIAILITDKDSFAHHAKYSRLFRQKWQDCQEEDFNSLLEILECLCHTECRFDSRSELMCRDGAGQMLRGHAPVPFSGHLQISCSLYLQISFSLYLQLSFPPYLFFRICVLDVQFYLRVA